MIDAALAAWRDLLGSDRVLVDGGRLALAGQATFLTTQRVPAMLEPADRDEVAACLRIAHRYRVPVYPVSAGRNWGYGSRVPPRDGTVLLSLARLNRILDFSEELAYVTVEPGVTYRALAAYLAERGSGLMPPVTGTSPDASLIGNAVERGIGKGVYEEMSARTCGYEVILPTGETVHTGFAGYPGAVTGPLRGAGPGPALQGLFVQSNLGVVTRMTLWLDPAPAWRQHLFFPVADMDRLAAVTDSLRGLLLRSGNGLQAEVVNDYRVVAMNRQFPYGEVDSGRVLPREWVQESMGPGYARWYGRLTLWAESREELDCRCRRVTDTVGPLLCGEPGPGFDPEDMPGGVPSTYWRKRMPVPADPDPDRDGCGVIWLAPVLPMAGAPAAAALEQMEETMLAHGFEPFISLRMVGGRAMQAIVNMAYDREEAGADERALQCHGALRALLNEHGLVPYRLSLLDMESPLAVSGESEALLRSLKGLLDPHGVLAPGRYIRP